jgi:ATP-binding cassette subfamily F protein uup
LEDARAQRGSTEITRKSPAEKPEKTNSNQKLTYKERQEWDQLEGRMAELETRKKETESLLTQTTDHPSLRALSEQLQKVQQALEDAEMRWLELSERLDQQPN